MGNHQAGDLVLRHNGLGQSENLLRRGRVQGGGVFVQKQQLGGDHSGHQQGQCLALAPGKQTHRTFHPVFQPQFQLGKPLPEFLPLPAGDHGEGRAALAGPHIGQGQIFLNGHVGGGAFQRVLEQPPDVFAALVVRLVGDVYSVQADGALVHRKRTGNGVEQRGFSRPVGAQNGDKVSLCQLQIHIGQRLFLVYCAGIEGFGQIGKLQHFSFLPSRRFWWRASWHP